MRKNSQSSRRNRSISHRRVLTFPWRMPSKGEVSGMVLSINRKRAIEESEGRRWGVAEQAPRSSFNSPQREWTGSRFTPSFYASSWPPRPPFFPPVFLADPGYIMILSRGRRPTDLTIDRAFPRFLLSLRRRTQSLFPLCDAACTPTPTTASFSLSANRPAPGRRWRGTRNAFTVASTADLTSECPNDGEGERNDRNYTFYVRDLRLSRDWVSQYYSEMIQ